MAYGPSRWQSPIDAFPTIAKQQLLFLVLKIVHLSAESIEREGKSTIADKLAEAYKDDEESAYR